MEYTNVTFDIIANIKQGNRESFKDFFDMYYDVLCVFAEKYTGNIEVCEDVVQEAFVKYWQNREQFDDIRAVKSYLYTIVRNRLLNILKHNKFSESDERLKTLESQECFRNNIIEQETYRLVRDAVDSLPSQMRKIIRLSMQGIKNPEIALFLGISPNTVRTLKKRAYKKLRAELREHFYLIIFF